MAAMILQNGGIVVQMEEDRTERSDALEVSVAKENKKSKLVRILLLTVILLLLLGNIAQGLYGYKLREEYKRLAALYGLYANSVTVDEFYQWVDAGEDRLIYVGRSDCKSCTDFAPTLYEVVAELEMLDMLYYLDVGPIRTSSGDLGWEAFKERFGQIMGTPSLIHIRGGETVASLSWPEDGGTVRAWLLAQK